MNNIFCKIFATEQRLHDLHDYLMSATSASSDGGELITNTELAVIKDKLRLAMINLMDIKFDIDCSNIVESYNKEVVNRHEKIQDNPRYLKSVFVIHELISEIKQAITENNEMLIRECLAKLSYELSHYYQVIDTAISIENLSRGSDISTITLYIQAFELYFHNVFLLGRPIGIQDPGTLV